MALEENEVEVVQGVVGNPTEFRGLGRKAGREGTHILTSITHNKLFPKFMT